MSNNKRYFHFTLGPVQGFVSQARRTRDFWAGSFLLSWLSGVAMQASIQQGATIEFPKANKEYLKWITGEHRGKKDTPRQGSIPNRFKAEIDKNFDPKLVEQSVQVAWQALADLVYDKDMTEVTNEKTRKIWDRQIEGFWEMSWVIADTREESAVLDQRKNWRSYHPPAEPGVKCMMMDGWQELSGTPSPHQKGLASFWKKVRDVHTNMASDLYEEEALCAIAFVKRRFVRYFEYLQHITMPSGGWSINGWELQSGVPSVSYLAAVHWLEDVMKQAKNNPDIKEKLAAFHNAAYELTKERGGWSNRIKCIEDLVDSRESKDWVSHDGNVFFQTVLENKKQYSDQRQVKQVVKKLNALNKAADVAAVTPFYAVLMMDGDSLGKQMSVLDNQSTISDALASFTDNVADIVRDHDGFLIYAGGDDVLAVLPLEDAMSCAKALRDDYNQCFANTNIKTSLSGAIEYAHIKIPLTKVLKDAHDLLDNIAKDHVGRDALAVRVWRPGGKAVQWAQPWEHLVSESDEIVLQSIINTFQKNHIDDAQFSSKFFYKIRERFDLLNPPKEGDAPVLKHKQAISLMAMEYINSGSATAKNMKEAEAVITPLLSQCRPHYRDEEQDGIKPSPSDYLQADGALLVRFLAQKGVE